MTNFFYRILRSNDQHCTCCIIVCLQLEITIYSSLVVRVGAMKSSTTDCSGNGQSLPSDSTDMEASASSVSSMPKQSYSNTQIQNKHGPDKTAKTITANKKPANKRSAITTAANKKSATTTAANKKSATAAADATSANAESADKKSKVMLSTNKKSDTPDTASINAKSTKKKSTNATAAEATSGSVASANMISGNTTYDIADTSPSNTKLINKELASRKLDNATLANKKSASKKSTVGFVSQSNSIATITPISTSTDVQSRLLPLIMPKGLVPATTEPSLPPTLIWKVNKEGERYHFTPVSSQQHQKDEAVGISLSADQQCFDEENSVTSVQKNPYRKTYKPRRRQLACPTSSSNRVSLSNQEPQKALDKDKNSMLAALNLVSIAAGSTSATINTSQHIESTATVTAAACNTNASSNPVTRSTSVTAADSQPFLSPYDFVDEAPVDPPPNKLDRKSVV